MEMLKYNKSVPGPNSYTIPTTLEHKGASLKPRLADTSLKYLKDVSIQIIIGPWAWSIFCAFINQQWRTKNL